MKHMMTCCLLSAIAVSVHAGEAFEEMKKKASACDDLTSYSAIAYCNQNLLKESDALLNKEYTELKHYLTGTDKRNLIDAQSQWIKFRDADCHFAEPRPGEDSIVSANRTACLAERTIERLKHLENYNVPWNKGCNGCPW